MDGEIHVAISETFPKRRVTKNHVLGCFTFLDTASSAFVKYLAGGIVMAGGNKKKKKPTANSARGYATVSAASKNVLKDEKEAASTDDSGVDTPVITSATDNSQDVRTKDTASVSVLSNLSPEELEAHLETSELQAFVERYGPKVKKESSRHAQRLRTERRVMRGQAEFLSVKHWLPEELMEELINLVHLDVERESGSGHVRDASHSDDLLANVWTLRMVLLEIGVSLLRANEVIAQLVCSGKSA